MKKSERISAYHDGNSPDSVAAFSHAQMFFLGNDFQPPKFDTSNALRAEQQKNELFKTQMNNVENGVGDQNTSLKLPRTPQKLPLKLPDLPEVLAEASVYVGPTRESNWVILDRFMVGAYPSSFDDDENESILRGILECGITTFVCLQLEYQHGVPESQWRSGISLRPYIEDALEICEKEKSSGKIVAPNELKFLHHGIVDCGTTTDMTVLELALDVCWRLLADEIIYLHCWGGHGRTGTVVAVALGLMYDLPASEALARTQLYHDLRVCSLNVPSPQTPQQRRQVERILDAVARGEYAGLVPPLPLVRPMSPLAQAPSPRFVKTIKKRTSDGWDGVQ